MSYLRQILLTMSESPEMMSITMMSFRTIFLLIHLLHSIPRSSPNTTRRKAVAVLEKEISRANDDTRDDGV
jgi:hypothetical protein